MSKFEALNEFAINKLRHEWPKLLNPLFRKISFWSKSLISGFRQNSPQPKHFAVVVPQLAMAGVHLVGQMISLGFQLKNDLLKIKVNITKNIVPTLVLQSKGYTYLTHNQSNIIL